MAAGSLLVVLVCLMLFFFLYVIVFRFLPLFEEVRGDILVFFLA
jgi:hypothetical protein